ARARPTRRSPRPFRARRGRDRRGERVPLVLSSREKLLRHLDPLEALLLAEDLEGLVERRADLASRDRHSDRGVELASGPTELLSETDQRRLDQRGVERLKWGEHRARPRQGLDGRDAVVLLRDEELGLVADVLGEQE